MREAIRSHQTSSRGNVWHVQLLPLRVDMAGGWLLVAGGWWLTAAAAAAAYLPVARRQAELGKFRTRCLFEAERLLRDTEPQLSRRYRK